MTKSESQMMKGIAILLMIYLHLFYRTTDTGEWSSLIMINGLPLASILAKAANPVGFYLVLGGYGMYKVYLKGDKHRFSRVGKLYITYWISLVIFVTLGHFMRAGNYPGSIKTLLINITGYNTTYVTEMWFLLPYVILTLISPYLFKIYSRFKSLYIIAVLLFLNISAGYCISRYSAFLYANRFIYTLVLVVSMSFNFSLGALAARENFFDRARKFFKRQKWGIVLAVSIIVV